MINTENLKLSFKCFSGNKKNKNKLFRYTEKLKNNNINLPLNYKNQDIFYISYNNNNFYFGIGECLKYELSSEDELLNFKKQTLDINDYGNNQNIPIQYFGGLCFDLQSTFNGPWDDIPKGKFVIPKILIYKKNNSLFISIQINNNPNSYTNVINEYSKLLETLKLQKEDHQKYIKINQEKNYPNKKEYSNIFNYYINKIKNKAYNKIVLSRTKHITINKNINFKQIFNNMDKNCTNFLFTLNNRYFIGSTPEKLINIENRIFNTEAIAGTYKKNNNNFQKERKKFLSDQKEIREHKYVSNYLYKILKKYSNQISMSKYPKILELKDLYHLKTSIKGKFNNKIHIIDIVNKLYPTPAVAGQPKNKTLKEIRKKEEKSRGWYSGCIGWFDLNGNGRFDVAIRSALQDKKTVHFYAGGGILKNSNLEKEWNETESKFLQLLSIL